MTRALRCCLALALCVAAACSTRTPTAPVERAVLCQKVSHRCVDTLWVAP